MAKSTARIGDVEVDKDTLYLAMEEASASEPVTRGRILFSTAITIAFCIAVWIGGALDGSAGLRAAVVMVGAVVVVAVVFPMFGGNVNRKRRLRIALNKRGYRLCVTCGYDLRALPVEIEKCPECGAQRTPEQSLSHSSD